MRVGLRRPSHQYSTCCDRAQTDAVRAGLYHLTRTGEADEECVVAWQSVQCSACDARSGVAPDVPVCDSVCDKLHAKCSDAFFSLDPVRCVASLDVCGFSACGVRTCDARRVATARL